MARQLKIVSAQKYDFYLSILKVNRIAYIYIFRGGTKQDGIIPETGCGLNKCLKGAYQFFQFLY